MSPRIRAPAPGDTARKAAARARTVRLSGGGRGRGGVEDGGRRAGEVRFPAGSSGAAPEVGRVPPPRSERRAVGGGGPVEGGVESAGGDGGRNFSRRRREVAHPQSSWRSRWWKCPVALEDFGGAGDDGRVPAPVVVHPPGDFPPLGAAPRPDGIRGRGDEARERRVRDLRVRADRFRGRGVAPASERHRFVPAPDGRPGPGETRAQVGRSGEDEPEPRPASPSRRQRSAGAPLLPRPPPDRWPGAWSRRQRSAGAPLLPAPAGGPRREGGRRARPVRAGARFREVARAWKVTARSVEEPHPRRAVFRADEGTGAPPEDSYPTPSPRRVAGRPAELRRERARLVSGRPKPLPRSAGPHSSPRRLAETRHRHWPPRGRGLTKEETGGPRPKAGRAGRSPEKWPPDQEGVRYE